MSNPPLVSIVIPCLNRAIFVVPTIESILQQDYPHIECIVVDGSSADGTVDLLKSYGNRIKWISEPDEGHADAINKGWKMSKGEILAWLNADDCYVLPDAVRKAVDYLQSHPEVDVVYGDHDWISEEGEVISDVIQHRPWNLVHAVKYCDHIITQPASFIRRSILEKVNWLDPEFRNGKDHELWLRIGRAGSIRYSPMLLAHERRTPGLTQHVSVADAMVRLTQKFFDNPNLPPPFDSKTFRRRAMSNAYLTGSEHVWRGGHVKKALQCFFKAIATDPINSPHLFARGSATVVATFLPERLKKIIRRMLGITRTT
jgi:glycosyltransferase involved in cell wall biosynthesis